MSKRLEERVEELEKRVRELEVQPRETHHHYHYEYYPPIYAQPLQPVPYEPYRIACDDQRRVINFNDAIDLSVLHYPQSGGFH